MVRDDKRVVILNRYEHRVVVNALNEMRNCLIGEAHPTDPVDEILLKTIDAPRKKRRLRDEVRS